MTRARSAFAFLLAILCATLLHPAASAQCERWAQGNIFASLSNGNNPGTVYATIAWSPTGGSTPTTLVAAGQFDHASGQRASNIAWWSGTTWVPFPKGPDADVYCLAIWRNPANFKYELIAGGSFYQQINVSTGLPTGSPLYHIARWEVATGTWKPLDVGFNNNVRALAVYQTNLIATGDFFLDGTGQTSLNHIAKWTGFSAHWSTLGSGFDSSSGHALLAWDQPFLALTGGAGSSGETAADDITRPPAPDGGNSTIATRPVLIVGGQFEQIGPQHVQVNNVALWNGSSWEVLGSGDYIGADGEVNALVAFDNRACMTGGFSRVGYNNQTGDRTLDASNIASWGGDSDWAAFAEGLGNTGSALAVHSNQLYAGGWFTQAGQVSANYVARWTGSAWAALGTGTNYPVFSLRSFGGNLIVGGAFDLAGDAPNWAISRWNGTTWEQTALPDFDYRYGPIHVFTTYNGDLIAGGSFYCAAAGVWNLARWDGSQWHSVGGLNLDPVAEVEGMTVFQNKLYVSGDYGLMEWNGTTWVQRVSTIYDIDRLVVYNNELIAATAWSGMPAIDSNGVPGLYNIARWDGNPLHQWQALSDWDLDFWLDETGALTVYNGELIVGGNFHCVGPPSDPCSGIEANNIARWDGTQWRPLLPGSGSPAGVDGTVEALRAYNGMLIAGGQFLNAGGDPSPHIALWHPEPNDLGAWKSLTEPGEGTDGPVYALTNVDEGLIVGGHFSSVAGIPANNLAVYRSFNLTTPYWKTIDGAGATGDVYALDYFRHMLQVGGNFGLMGGQVWPKWNRYGNPCYGDCNCSGTVTAADFTCFFNSVNGRYQASLGLPADMQANSFGNCDGSAGVDAADVTCYQSLVNLGSCNP